MNNIVSQKMSRGQGNELLNKLEAAGLNDELAQRVIDSKGNTLATKVVERIQELTPSWREEDGVIYFSVTSDGTTGEEWITRLEGKGIKVNIGNYAKQVLCSSDFKPTSGVTTHVAVLKGTLFEYEDRNTNKIRAEGDKREFTKPNAEVSCLIREKFTDKEIQAMGLWYIVAMHEPIDDSDGDPCLLSVDCYNGGRWLYAYDDRPDSTYDRNGGFAFAVSQHGSQP